MKKKKKKKHHLFLLPMDDGAAGLMAEWLTLLAADDASSAAFLSATGAVQGDQYKSRVIEQDVVRTRADETFYAARSVRCLMNEVLVRYCAHYRLQYMQGLNEILAPFLRLGASSSGAGGVTACARWEGPGAYPMEDCERDTCMMHHHHHTNGDGADSGAGTFPVPCGPACPLCAQRRAFDTPLLLFERFVALMAPVTFATAGVQVRPDLRIVGPPGSGPCRLTSRHANALSDPSVRPLCPTPPQALQAQLASVHLLLYYTGAPLPRL